MQVNNAVGQRVSSQLGELELLRLLGKGKSAYSYLAQGPEQQYVVKLMHAEPCPYYDFGDNNKVELEQAAYARLKASGIAIPQLLDANPEQAYLVKEFLEGDLVTDLVIRDALPQTCVQQVCQMAKRIKALGLNIDYYPDNFILNKGRLYYLDYETNPYEEQWDLAHWGLYYWANSAGMKAYKTTGDASAIHQPVDSAKPITEPFLATVNQWLADYA
ncbi:hypothetical protein [Agarivorans gilvus]|jgi:hypothetical protein|uniref:Serine/threonine protein kinase n=1 Tax=Agarivorans gilvus TaxID=680279 RepID=A0ABQ1I5L5_9ALTE|nr:hypothetical protein [Agarivorans gilvus]GGB15398.1 hypothetical protein GCM10007414_31060 [Agarivorans gilvus]